MIHTFLFSYLFTVLLFNLWIIHMLKNGQIMDPEAAYRDIRWVTIIPVLNTIWFISLFIMYRIGKMYGKQITVHPTWNLMLSVTWYDNSLLVLLPFYGSILLDLNDDEQ